MLSVTAPHFYSILLRLWYSIHAYYTIRPGVLAAKKYHRTPFLYKNGQRASMPSRHFKPHKCRAPHCSIIFIYIYSYSPILVHSFTRYKNATYMSRFPSSPPLVDFYLLACRKPTLYSLIEDLIFLDVRSGHFLIAAAASLSYIQASFQAMLATRKLVIYGQSSRSWYSSRRNFSISAPSVRPILCVTWCTPGIDIYYLEWWFLPGRATDVDYCYAYTARIIDYWVVYW